MIPFMLRLLRTRVIALFPLLLATPSIAQPSPWVVHCDLETQDGLLQEIVLLHFDDRNSILLPSDQGWDGGGLLKREWTAESEIQIYSNECDNWYQFEFKRSEIDAFRNARAQGEDSLVLRGRLTFWQEAKPENAVQAELTCVTQNQ